MARFLLLFFTKIFWCLLMQVSSGSSAPSIFRCSNNSVLDQDQFNENGCACFTNRHELREAALSFYKAGCSDNNNCNNTIVQKYGWPMGSWCVASISTMAFLFFPPGNIVSTFNDDISSWNVASVTNMRQMFLGASSFNQDLSSWDTTKVTDMHGMFLRASSFNQDLSSWNVSAVTNMHWMFYNAESFNQDLSSWDVSKVTDAEKMFEGATAFDVSAVCNWNDSWKELLDCKESPPISKAMIITIVGVSLGLIACVLVAWYLRNRKGLTPLDLRLSMTPSTAVLGSTTIASETAAA